MQTTRNSLAGRPLVRQIGIKIGEEKTSSCAVNWQDYGCWAEYLRTGAIPSVIRQQELSVSMGSYPQLAEIKVNPFAMNWCTDFSGKNWFAPEFLCAESYGRSFSDAVILAWTCISSRLCDYLLYLPQLCGKTFFLFSNGFQLSFFFFVTCYAMLRSCFSWLENACDVISRLDIESTRNTELEDSYLRCILKFAALAKPQWDAE